MAAEDVVDDYSGMISKDMANNIIKNSTTTSKKASIEGILKGNFNENDIVDVEATVYRIFNIKTIKRQGGDITFREMSLSSNGNVVTLTLRRKAADMVDVLGIERGDVVAVNGAVVVKNSQGFSLASTSSTYIVRLRPSNSGITNYTLLRSGEKDKDVIGKLTSIGPIKYFVGLNGRQNSVTRCIISDGSIELPLVLWGSSSESVQKAHPGDYIKIEFAAIKERNGTLEVHANEFSRVFLSASLKKRFATSDHTGR